MKVSLERQAPNIVLAFGAEKIVIKHRYMLASERVRVLEFLADSMQAAMQFAWDFIDAVEGIKNEAGGAVPERILVNGVERSPMELLCSVMPLEVQVETWLTQLALNGVKHKALEILMDRWLDEQARKRVEEHLAPLADSSKWRVRVPSSASAFAET